MRTLILSIVGEVTPLFSIGASLGILAGNLLGISPVVCAALGYAAVFGSATNTLLAPVMIGLEVFGTENAIPLVVVCILAYLMNGGSSIYTAQQRAVLKLDGEKEAVSERGATEKQKNKAMRQ